MLAAFAAECAVEVAAAAVLAIVDELNQDAQGKAAYLME